MAERYLFTTEGHVIPITSSLRSLDWENDEDMNTFRLPSSRSRKSQFRNLSQLSETNVDAFSRNSTHSVVSNFNLLKAHRVINNIFFRLK